MTPGQTSSNLMYDTPGRCVRRRANAFWESEARRGQGELTTKTPRSFPAGTKHQVPAPGAAAAPHRSPGKREGSSTAEGRGGCKSVPPSRTWAHRPFLQSFQRGPPLSPFGPPPHSRWDQPPPLSNLSPQGPSRQRDASITAAQKVASTSRTGHLLRC